MKLSVHRCMVKVQCNIVSRQRTGGNHLQSQRTILNKHTEVYLPHLYSQPTTSKRRFSNFLESFRNGTAKLDDLVADGEEKTVKLPNNKEIRTASFIWKNSETKQEERSAEPDSQNPSSTNPDSKTNSQDVPGKREYDLALEFYSRYKFVDALPLFQQALFLKYPPCFYYLEWYMHYGIVIPKDRLGVHLLRVQAKEYEPWFREKAASGQHQAVYNLACYLEMMSEFGKSAELFQNLADQGDFQCWYKLACVQHKQGHNTEAFNNLQKAFEKRVSSASYALGDFYDCGIGTTKNLQKALSMFRIGASRNPLSQYRLGQFYFDGIAVKQDYVEAIILFSKAADQGIPQAQRYLGLCYEEGKGVEINPEKAFLHYLSAAKLGDAIAQYKVGKCYFWGLGVKIDDDEAQEWGSKALKQGVDEANEYLDLIGL